MAPVVSQRDDYRVLIVEDQTLMADLLSSVLELARDLTIVGVVGTVAAAIEQVRTSRPDLVLMDYHLPDGTGVQAIRTLDAAGLQADVLMLSSDSEEAAVEEAIRAGAIGYLLKSEPSRLLIDGIRRAAAGELVLPTLVLQRIAARTIASRPQATRGPLDIALRLAAGGAAFDQIASVLGADARTARAQLLAALRR